MQSYTQIQSSQSLQSSLALLLNNDRTTLSNSSGTAFPTVGIEVGMACFRTDQKKLYLLTRTSPEPEWMLLMDLSAVTNLGDDPQAQTPQMAYMALARRTSGDDGGAISFERPESGSTLAGNVALRLKGDRFEVYDRGTGTRGFFLDFTKATAAIAAKIWHSGDMGVGSGLDADKLDGMQSGNASGNIPINNGSLNKNLNAEMLDGRKSNLYALLANPAFTGAPTAPTAATSSNTDQLATTAFVQRALGTVDLGSKVAKSGDSMQGPLSIEAGSLSVFGWSGNTNAGVIFLNASKNRYLYFDGGKYNLPGATLLVNGSEVLTKAGAGNSVSLSGAVSLSVGLVRSGSTITPRLTVGNCNCACDCACDCTTCFPTGARILMSNGTQKDIANIEAGDWVQGPTRAWQVARLERVKLGPRRMTSFANGRLPRTEEHLIWARRGDQQWFWTGNLSLCLREVELGAVAGLFDHTSILTGGDVEYASIHDVWSHEQIVDITHCYSPDTPVYMPVPEDDSDRIAIVDGYLVTCSTDQNKFDYSKFSWDADKARAIRKKARQ